MQNVDGTIIDSKFERTVNCSLTSGMNHLFPSLIMFYRIVQLVYMFRLYWSMRFIKAPKVVQCFIGAFSSMIALALLISGLPALTLTFGLTMRIVSWEVSLFFSLSFLIWGNYGHQTFKRLRKCSGTESEMLSDLDTAVATSTKSTASDAVEECIVLLHSRLENWPSFVVAYCSSEYGVESISRALKEQMPSVPFVSLGEHIRTHL